MFHWNRYCKPVYDFYWGQENCSDGDIFLLWTKTEVVISQSTSGSTTLIPKEKVCVATYEFLLKNHYEGAFLGIGVSGDLAADFLEIITNGFWVSSIEETLFFQIYDGMDTIREEKKSVLLYALLCDLAVNIEKNNGEYPFLVKSAIEEIHFHYREIYGVEELSNSLEVSKSHLIRVFQKATGYTPGKYLMMVRLDSAKRGLQQGLPLDLVAEMNGFSSAGYFCKVFKKEFEETPNQWKRRNLTHISLAPKDEYEEELLLYL